MRLSRRERLLLGVGVLVAAVAMEEWVFRPLWLRQRELHRRVELARQDLRSMEDLLGRHRRYSSQVKEMERKLIRRGDGFSLFSFLEDAAGKAGVRDRLVAMNPSESNVGGYRRFEMLIQLEDLNVSQVIGYLGQISIAPRLLRVSRLNLERSQRQPGKVKVTALVVSFGEPVTQEAGR